MQQENHTWSLWIRKVLWHVGIAHSDGYLCYICQAEPGCSERWQSHWILFFTSPFDWLGFLFVPEIKNWHGPQIYWMCPNTTRPFVCLLHSDPWVPQGLLHQQGAHWGSGGPACPLCKYHLTSSGALMYSPSPAPSLINKFDKDCDSERISSSPLL